MGMIFPEFCRIHDILLLQCNCFALSSLASILFFYLSFNIVSA